MGFPELLAKYSGYDSNKDGVAEIEKLQLMPFEPPADPPASKRGWVLVLVESRLLSALPSGAPGPEELVSRLSRYKADLETEGYAARVVEARVYSGPIHQDGRTLLALREFLKEVRAAWGTLAGVILVGSFPEATLFRTYMEAHRNAVEVNGQSFPDGTRSYNVGCGYHAMRSEIVLADLDGNWPALYQQGPFQVTSHRFVPVSEVSVPGPSGKPRIQATFPTNRLQASSTTVQDVFWLQDAQLSLDTSNPSSIQATLSLEDAGPELSTADRALPNPISRPELFVSRINARNVAVNPNPGLRDAQGRGFVDASGRPQTVEFDHPIDLRNESFWRWDPVLERTLLIDYFDRNHQFRTGEFHYLPYRLGILETDLSHGVEGTLDKASRSFEGRTVLTHATMTDLLNWLRSPATIRGITSHAASFGSEMGGNYDPAALQASLGGAPWRWEEEHVGNPYRYTPSVAHLGGQADLTLLRTIWENGLAEGASFFLHTGCHVNTPGHVEQLPYSQESYGSFQHAEALLFYANGLAVMSRAWGFNDCPREFGEAIGATPESCFGEGWRRYFEVEARDVGLGEVSPDTGQHIERKRSSMWSLLGDWTLRKRYSGVTLPAFFTRESILLARLGGYASAARNQVETAFHRDWAMTQSAARIIDDLVDKYRLQIDRQRTLGTTNAATFFADTALRLRSHGIVFTVLNAPDPNSIVWDTHYRWALGLLQNPSRIGLEHLRDELRHRIIQACQHVLANQDNLARMIFVSEAVLMARGGGFSTPARNNPDPAFQRSWAESNSLALVRDELIDRYCKRIDQLQGAGGTALADFYASACLRLNALGVSFGSASADSLDPSTHSNWVPTTTSLQLKGALEMRVCRLFEFLATSPLDPLLEVSPLAIDFGMVRRGKKAPLHQVTLTNKGIRDLTLRRISIREERLPKGGPHFVLWQAPEQERTLPSQQRLDFMVAFSATQFGSYTARLVVESDASRPVVELPLTGSVGL